jgi:hypothetical protein
MKDSRRKVERFDLHVETILYVHDKGTIERTCRLISRDFSSDGVFLTTNSPLPIGTTVDLIFLLSPHELNINSNKKKVHICTSGRVIRKEERGFALEFKKTL